MIAPWACFDSVYCHVELESLGLVPTWEFQTKDFDCTLDKLHITAEGRLISEGRRWYDKDWDKENPNPKDLEYHGYLRFYGGKFEDTPEGERYHSYEYKAKFTDGNLVDMTFLGDTWAGSNVKSARVFIEEDEDGEKK